VQRQRCNTTDADNKLEDLVKSLSRTASVQETVQSSVAGTRRACDISIQHRYTHRCVVGFAPVLATAHVYSWQMRVFVIYRPWLGGDFVEGHFQVT